jgi:hypothetical protein
MKIDELLRSQLAVAVVNQFLRDQEDGTDVCPQRRL